MIFGFKDLYANYCQYFFNCNRMTFLIALLIIYIKNTHITETNN